MAKRGLRCICLTYTVLPKEDPSRPADFFEEADNVNQNLVCTAIVGIKDPVRKEVPEAVRICKGAGITVRMVTGDNIHTAQHIARECGILYDTEHYAMEGPTFRGMTEEELLPNMHNLRVSQQATVGQSVVARSCTCLQVEWRPMLAGHVGQCARLCKVANWMMSVEVRCAVGARHGTGMAWHGSRAVHSVHHTHRAGGV